MKRFLSILLALAVGFTFTFGSAMSAFAANVTINLEYELSTTAQTAVLDELSTAKDDAIADINALKTEYLRNYNVATKIDPIVVEYATENTTKYNITISKDALIYGDNSAIDGAIEKLVGLVEKAYNEQVIVVNTGKIDYTKTYDNSGNAPTANLADAKAAVLTAVTTAAGKATTENVTKLLKGEEVLPIATNVKAVDGLVEAEYDVQQEDALEEIAKAKAVLANYSKDIPKTATITVDGTDRYASNYDIAALMLDIATTIVNVDFDKTDNAAKLATAKLMKTSVGNGKFVATVENVITVDADGNYKVKFNAFEAPTAVGKKDGATFCGNDKVIYTAKDDAKAERSLAEEKAYQIDRVKGEIAVKKAAYRKAWNTALDTANTATAKTINAALAKLDADFAAVEEVAVAQINATETVGTDATAGSAVKVGTDLYTDIKANNKYVYAAYVADAYINLCVAKSNKVAQLNALAATMKAMTGLDGKFVYNADLVDDALEDDIAAVYAVAYDAGFADATDGLTNIKNAVNAAAGALAGMGEYNDPVKAAMVNVIGAAGIDVTLDKVVYPTIAKWEAAVAADSYDEDNSDTVLAIAKETKAAVRAAKTVEAVNAAFLAGYEKYAAVKTTADRVAYQAAKATKDAIKAYKAKLTAAIATKAAEYGPKFNKDYDVNANLDEKLVDAYLETAYNDAGLEAGFQKALEEIANLKTKAELVAEQKAINDAVVAFKNVTLADEAAVVELQGRIDDFNDYKVVVGLRTNDDDKYPTYALGALAVVQNLAYEAIAKQVADINKGGVTVSDEVAIDTLVAAADAYYANYGAVCNNAADIARIEAALENAKVADLESKIGKIDASANPVDAAAVKAAREAYDALGETPIDPTAYNKLLSLETLVAQQEKAEAEANKYDTTKVKSFLQDAAVKASSTVSGKKVTVTANADVQELIDNGYTVEFKFFKSKKASSGYKATVTKNAAESKTYTNTKASKGANYYKYIIIVTDAEGNEVAKTTLKECAYAKRTIK